MSSPTEQQPFSPTNAWQGQQPMPAQAPPPNLPPNLPPNSPPYWPPPPQAPKQTSGVAIAALVVGSLVLLLGLGFVVSQVLFGVVLGGVLSGTGGLSPDGGELGTAAQVVAGQPYPGALLQVEVARVVRGSYGDVTSISCPATPAVVAEAVTVCHGVVDGSSWSFRVTFEDGSGHFTLDEKVN